MRFESIRTGIRGLLPSAVVLALVVTTGPGEASAAGKRADLFAAGVDMMTVGTAKQVDRAKRLRPRQTP